MSVGTVGRRLAGVLGILAMACLPGGCAAAGQPSAGTSEGGCAAVKPTVEVRPARAEPNASFTVRGENFAGRYVCNDAGTGGPQDDTARSSPARNIRVEFVQDGDAWQLGTVDADEELAFDESFEVPAGARPGRAIVAATDRDYDPPQAPPQTPFRVLGEPDGAPPATGEPPRSTLSFGDRTIDGALGSYCWTDACADTMGIAVPPEEDALPVPAGVGVVFRFGGGGAALVRAEAVPLDGEDVRLLPGPGGTRFLEPKGNRVWPKTRPLEVDRASGKTFIDAGLPPGEYALNVFVRVPEGDASYDFRVKVEPEAKDVQSRMGTIVCYG